MLRSINPATGQLLASHAELDPGQVDRSIERAAQAWRDWRRSPIPERTALLEAIAERFESDGERLAEMASLEMGKTIREARAEVAKCATGFRYYAEKGPQFLETLVLASGTGEARWQPIGPVLAVMPWNFPYWQVVRFLAPAILAGNVGLLKHASNVQGVAGLIAETVESAGAPAGLFQNLAIGSDKVAGVIADTRVAAVTLTGSEGAGRAVAAQAGKALKKVVLELGGSDPFIVMPSADVDAAVETAVKARIQNAGQSCICGKRMIVHSDIYAQFAGKFTEAMLAIEPGDPFDEDSDIGPLSSHDQRDTVCGQLEQARKEGAKLAGGETVEGSGAYMRAGVLTGVDPDGAIHGEEIFGPVAMLFEADDLDSILAIANGTPFGLGASIWTNEDDERDRLVETLQCGMVAVNRLLASSPEAPFGGIKASGHGRELGPWGMHEFMNLKTVLTG